MCVERTSRNIEILLSALGPNLRRSSRLAPSVGLCVRSSRSSWLLCIDTVLVRVPAVYDFSCRLSDWTIRLTDLPDFAQAVQLVVRSHPQIEVSSLLQLLPTSPSQSVQHPEVDLWLLMLYLEQLSSPSCNDPFSWLSSLQILDLDGAVIFIFPYKLWSGIMCLR